MPECLNVMAGPEKDEQFLKSLIDASTTSLSYLGAVRNAENKIVDFKWKFQNESAREHAGSDLTGRCLFSELLRPLAQLIFDHYVSCIEQNICPDFDLEREINGNKHWFRATCVKLGDGIVVSEQDITGRKKIEAQAIEQAEEILRLNLEQQKAILNAIITAQENERARIGESLHDGVAQLLYAIQTRIHLISVSENDRKYVSEILEIVEQAILQTRNISFELVPVILTDYGIQAAVRELFKRVFGDAITYELIFEADEKLLSTELKTATYRIVQELCNNIVRHANASHATVKVSTANNSLHIVLSDNGKGFNVSEQGLQTGGVGLHGVRNRISLLGGSFEISSEPGNTTVAIRLPFQSNNH